EYVIVGAHYDHLGTRSGADGRCTREHEPGGALCPGASDNAAGVAAVLAIGRALRRLPQPPRRSVVLALWDGEEAGMLGSRHYAGAPLVPLQDTVAALTFDIAGATILPSLADTTFALASETGGRRLADAVDAAARAEPALAVRRLGAVFATG